MIFSPNVQRPAPASFIVDTTSPERDMGKARQSDRFLLACIVALMAFGVLAVYSSIAYFAELKDTTPTTLVMAHVIKLIIAGFGMLVLSKIDYHHILRWSKVVLIVSWVLLVVVTLTGTEVFGARRSLNIGGFSFQPSSLAMIALLAWIVDFVRKKGADIRDFSAGVLPLLAAVGITCGLIAIEDFSSAGVLGVLAFIVMFAARVPGKYLATLVVIGAVGAAGMVMSTEFRVKRMQDYVDQIVTIKSDELVSDVGYQAQQAHIAIARGGLFGVGIGKSSQRDFLPAPYNDFIFAIVAEEYGLMGCLILLVLFTMILIRGIGSVARRAYDSSGALLALACTLGIVMYAYVNAAVATGLFPVTGLPMPFISYGGTSMLVAGAMMGILLNISKTRREDLA